MSDPTSFTDDPQEDQRKSKLRLDHSERSFHSNEPAEGEAKSVSSEEMLAVTERREASYIQFLYTGSVTSHIWISLINTAVLLLSCGILFPWTRARSKEYYYSNLVLDGDPFECRIKSGRSCLYCFLMALSFAGSITLMIYATFPYHIWVEVAIGFMGYVFLALMMKNMVKNTVEGTSYRGIAFKFNGEFLDAFVTYVIFPCLATVGMIVGSLYINTVVSYSIQFFWLAVIAYSHMAYRLKNMEFGRLHVTFSGNFKEFKNIYNWPLVLWILFNGAIIGTFYLLDRFDILSSQELLDKLRIEELNTNTIGMIEWIIIGLFAIETLWHAWAMLYIKVRSSSYYLERLELTKTQVIDAYSFGSYLWLSVTNHLIRILSLSLLNSWAVVREQRYFVERVAVMGHQHTLALICKNASEPPKESLN